MRRRTCGRPYAHRFGACKQAGASAAGHQESLAAPRAPGHRLARVSVGAAIGVGAVLGLAIGILVSVATDVPLAPEAGIVLGALVGWLSRRGHA